MAVVGRVEPCFVFKTSYTPTTSQFLTLEPSTPESSNNDIASPATPNPPS